MSKHKGYIKEGDVLFVASKYPQLSLVIDPGGEAIVGARSVKTKPRFIDFHPSIFGGEFRANAAMAKRMKMSLPDLLALLRERDSVDDKYCEVRDEAHLAELLALRDKIREDKVVERKEGVKTDELAAENEVPETIPAPAPKAARGPKRAPAAV